MILVRMNGGLGNQMFQYAFGRAIALVHQTELVYDLGWYRHTPKSNTLREFELHRYSIHGRESTEMEEAKGRLYTGRFMRRVPLLRRPWYHFREKSFDYDISIRHIQDNTYLDGYWQSYRYFAAISEILRTELTPKILPGAKDLFLLSRIEELNAVSVHVRRGDYVTKKSAAIVHGTCSPDYYCNALNIISTMVRKPHFYIFSDDAQWCRENLSFPGPATFVDHNGSFMAFQDLRLMSHCKHHIIANSSFSWWGAWLNSRSDKIVVAPNKWFMDGKSTNDLIPADWIRL